MINNDEFVKNDNFVIRTTLNQKTTKKKSNKTKLRSNDHPQANQRGVPKGLPPWSLGGGLGPPLSCYGGPPWGGGRVGGGPLRGDLGPPRWGQGGDPGGTKRPQGHILGPFSSVSSTTFIYQDMIICAHNFTITWLTTCCSLKPTSIQQRMRHWDCPIATWLHSLCDNVIMRSSLFTI